MVAARLRQVAPSGDAQLGGKCLEKHGDQTADQNYAQERVTEFRAAPDIRRPVPRIHVPHGNQVAGPGENQYFAEPGEIRLDGNRAVSFRQGGES